MPLGFERLNERQQRPNARINFIKPLPGPDVAAAQAFLERIAAQCQPIMRQHGLAVMALEEHVPNAEFLGRNFNAGEVVQLVLKDRRGRWLSFRFVQMVMMHELAHCKEMNHSRRFWAVRAEYAAQMEGLWRQGYTGEGMWGRGRGLESGAFIHERPPDKASIPEHLCGGSYRRRGKKRKRERQDEATEKLSYAERQQRRIARKFGKHGEGESLGEDELIRGALETMNGGKRGAGKPRVANSKRGRELRANAALARFSQAKAQKQEQVGGGQAGDVCSETESDWDDDIASDVDFGVATIKDEHGHDLFKVCGDEDEDDESGAGQEMDELRMLGQEGLRQSTKENAPNVAGSLDDSKVKSDPDADSPAVPQHAKPSPFKEIDSAVSTPVDAEEDNAIEDVLAPPDKTEDKMNDAFAAAEQSSVPSPHQNSNANSWSSEPARHSAANKPGLVNSPCPVCSLDNSTTSPTCMACAHVLRLHLMPDHWRCTSEACNGAIYVNAGDAGRCGLCGSPKPLVRVANRGSSGSEVSTGLTRAEVLRWD